MDDPSSGQPPSLSLLQTLRHPSAGASRSWQSLPHPDVSIPLLATASADQNVNVWSLRDFSLVSTISGGHKRSIRTVAWKDFGPQRQKRGEAKGQQPVILGTGSFDANVGIWAWNNEQRRSEFSGEANDGAAEEFDMGGAAEEDEEWHFSTLLTGPDSEIKSIAFSPHFGYPANLLATSSRDKSVWIWEEVEPEEWETIAVLSEHTGDVKCVSWCTGAQRRSTKRRKIENDGDVAMGENGDSQANGNTSTHVDDVDDEVILGARPTLASGSYDDTIRLWRDVEEEGDWMCVSVITDHNGTVWDLKWEPHINYSLLDMSQSSREGQHTATTEFEADWQPRIVSCSDDLTVRIWRRELSEAEKMKRRAQNQSQAAPMGFASSRIPSVIRPMSAMERWVEDSTLPAVHVRSVYAVDWSKRTGMIVSCGGDGTIAVYREVPLASPGTAANDSGQEAGDVDMNGTRSRHDPTSTSTENGTDIVDEPAEPYKVHASKWTIVTLVEGAHDEYEINHVCWAERRDKDRRFEGEEVIVSTGDEGDVRIWTLPEALVRDFQ